MFKRDGIWWVSITFRGRRIRRSTETSSLELAKAIESKLRTELIEEKYFDKCAGAEKTFKEMADRFMLEYALKKDANALQNNTGAFTSFFWQYEVDFDYSQKDS